MRFVIIIALVGMWVGCSKQVPHSGPTRGTEVGVWVYETFPPIDGKAPVKFRLTAAELEHVRAAMPDVSAADDYADKCGVPPFGIELFEAGAVAPFAEGHFFHGPDELMLSFRDRSPGRVRGTRAFYDAIVAVLEARGFRAD